VESVTTEIEQSLIRYGSGNLPPAEIRLRWRWLCHFRPNEQKLLASPAMTTQTANFAVSLKEFHFSVASARVSAI
jgi:hypothetical protein